MVNAKQNNGAADMVAQLDDMGARTLAFWQSANPVKSREVDSALFFCQLQVLSGYVLADPEQSQVPHVALGAALLHLAGAIKAAGVDPALVISEAELMVARQEDNALKFAEDMRQDASKRGRL